MAITPADIQAQTFSEAKRGYDPGEVDVFLEQLASEVDAMLSKIVVLKNRLTAAEQQRDEAQAQAAQAQAQAAQAAQAAQTQAPAPTQSEYGATERQISAALITAQQSADRIVEEARANAERIRNEADAKAREVIRQALQEKQNELEEIDRLKTSREDFRAEYLKLLQHFMDDAQNSFPADLLKSTSSSSLSSDPAPIHTAAPVVTLPGASAPEDPQSHVISDPFAPVPSFDVDDLD